MLYVQIPINLQHSKLLLRWLRLKLSKSMHIQDGYGKVAATKFGSLFVWEVENPNASLEEINEEFQVKMAAYIEDQNNLV